MGFLGKLFKGGDAGGMPAPAPPAGGGGTAGILDLTKGDILDLTKHSPNLVKVRAAAGWKVRDGGGYDYDLDLCAYLIDGDGGLVDTVFYHNLKSSGIKLDHDNLTGSREGIDDENIHANLGKIPGRVKEIYFAVVIYEASSRRQRFREVHDAYVRLVDESTQSEICRFRMGDDGGDNTAVLAAKLYRSDGGWSFNAIGEYSKNTISSLGREVTKRKG